MRRESGTAMGGSSSQSACRLLWVVGFFFYINNIPGCMTTLSSLNYLNLLKNEGKFALKSMRESGKCQCENEEEQRLMHHLSCCFPVTALPGT